jgi:hypothetical protein
MKALEDGRVGPEGIVMVRAQHTHTLLLILLVLLLLDIINTIIHTPSMA